MTSIILVRHCQSTGQETEAPLTETGQQQAQTLATFLSDYLIDHITTSQYLRAQQSVEPLAKKAGLPVHLDSRFNERTLSSKPIGDWQDVVRDSFEDPDLRAPGGESAREVLIRAWAALDDMLDEGHRLPLVVTHGYLMALVFHSIDPTFGYEGWSSLTNPDVFILRDAGSGQIGFTGIWADS